MKRALTTCRTPEERKNRAKQFAYAWRRITKTISPGSIDEMTVADWLDACAKAGADPRDVISAASSRLDPDEYHRTRVLAALAEVWSWPRFDRSSLSDVVSFISSGQGYISRTAWIDWATDVLNDLTFK